MVPSARVSDVRTMGEGKHARFSLHSGSHRALGVAFGRSSLGVGDDEPVDAAVRLEVNHWNGSVEPRVVLRELYPLGGAAEERLRCTPATAPTSEWWRRFEAELGRELGDARAGRPRRGAASAGARAVVRGGGSATVAIAELVSSGAGVLAVCADASRRAALASGATGLARFNGGAARIACHRCGAEAVAGLAARGGGGLALTDYAALGRARRAWSRGFEHVVLVDPPRRRRRRSAAVAPSRGGGSGPGFLHPLWTEAERRVRARRARRAGGLARRPSPPSSARLREAGETSGERACARRSPAAAPHPLAPEAAARCFRVLRELELVAGEPDGGDGVVGVVSSEGTDLERSAAFRAYSDRILGGPAIPRKTQTAVEHSELLADLFAVVEEFDSCAGARTATATAPAATAVAVATIDRAAVERAFDFACERHADQLRYSGDEFITHPVGVAQVCAGMRLDTETLCAALLHDTVEDTSASLEEIREEFGEEIAQLVDGVTKLTGMTFESRDERQAENYRKMMVAMATDVRVILIKLADRLHNMRTLGALPKQKQTAKSHETLEIYAPLAHRLGIHAIKWELEDLAFATLHPRKYAEIKQLVAQQRDERESYVTDAGEFLSEELEQVGIEAEISGRAKHFYSIYTKMAKKGREFNEIFDLTAMRVIVGSVKDCYGAIGVIHSLWKPLPGRFKDFVAMPKANMYQALHTTVIGPEGKPLEIQIRTEEMHKLAEYGIAAHVAYKEGGGDDPKREKMTWLRQLVEAEGEQDPAEFLESLKVDLFEDEVFVFTPKGEVKNLSAGSTPLDFAYAVHTDVGHRCVGAKVNGSDRAAALPAAVRRHRRGADREAESRPLARLAETGADQPRPQQDPRLLQRGAPRGRRAQGPRGARGSAAQARHPDAEGRRLGRCSPTSSARWASAKATDFYIALGQGKVSTKTAANKLMQRLKAGEAVEEEPARRRPTAARTAPGAPRTPPTTGSPSRAPTTSPCGWPSAAGRCPATRSPATSRSAAGSPSTAPTARTSKALKRAPERFVEVGWEGENESSYRVELQIDAYDRTRLLEDLSRTFSEAGINIIGASCTTNHPMVKNRFVVEVGDTEQLKHCISRLRNVESVFDAYRITPAA